jgi:glutamate synthase domain-containing protein 1
MLWFSFHAESIIVYNGAITRLRNISEYLKMTDANAEVRAASPNEVEHYLRIQNESDRAK